MNTRKHKILFVEDDHIDRIAFERFAKEESFPYEYVITASVEHTRKMLESDQFDAAVLDYALEDGTAFDLFNDLEGTPIILVTSAGTTEIAVNAMKKGAYDYLIKDPEGNYLKTLSLTVENAITRKQAEETLRETNERLINTLESISDGFFTLDNDLGITYFNRAAEQLLRRKSADVLGHNLFEAFPEAKGSIFEEQYTWALKEQQSLSFETYFGIQPYENWYDVRVYPSKDGISVYFQVTTERKRAEEELRKHRDHLEELVKERTTKLQEEIAERKQAEEALRQSEQRYRLLIENIPTVAWMSGQDGKTMFISSNVENVYGYTPDEILEKGEALWFGRIHPDDKDRVKKMFGLLFSEQRSFDIEYRIQRKDGEWIWLHDRANTVEEKAGQLYAYGVFSDITEEKRAQAEKAKLEKQLQHAQKMQAVGTLAGGIAHDFNNILGGIIGYTELTQDHIPEDARVQHYSNQVLKACNRAKDLIIQILTFSRQSTTEKQRLQLTSIIKEALKLLRSTIPTNIDIRYHAESDSGMVLADPTQIHQVLMNLCTNAAYALREKGGILEVALQEVEVHANNKDEYPELRLGAYVKLSISDTGYGMDNETLQRIFEPYFTTKAPDEGTGLGLSVTHGIVKDHGGTITVQSTPGRGSTFDVFLPMIEPKVAAEGEEYTPDPHGNERILFVDDEEFLIDIGQRMLKKLGYDVVATISSQEALELFRSQPDQFDLVITDQTMPKMTGVELATKLMEIRPDIPIILCTGFSEVITEEQARSLGIRAFLLKPISKRGVARAIRKVLEVS